MAASTSDPIFEALGLRNTDTMAAMGAGVASPAGVSVAMPPAFNPWTAPAWCMYAQAAAAAAAAGAAVGNSIATGLVSPHSPSASPLLLPDLLPAEQKTTSTGKERGSPPFFLGTVPRPSAQSPLTHLEGRVAVGAEGSPLLNSPGSQNQRVCQPNSPAAATWTPTDLFSLTGAEIETPVGKAGGEIKDGHTPTKDPGDVCTPSAAGTATNADPSFDSVVGDEAKRYDDASRLLETPPSRCTFRADAPEFVPQCDDTPPIKDLLSLAMLTPPPPPRRSIRLSEMECLSTPTQKARAAALGKVLDDQTPPSDSVASPRFLEVRATMLSIRASALADEVNNKTTNTAVAKGLGKGLTRSRIRAEAAAARANTVAGGRDDLKVAKPRSPQSVSVGAIAPEEQTDGHQANVAARRRRRGGGRSRGDQN